MSDNDGNALGTIGAFMLGIAVGGGVALLLASPQARSEIHKTLKTKVNELRPLLEEKRKLVEQLLAEGEEGLRKKIRRELKKLEERLAVHEEATEQETENA